MSPDQISEMIARLSTMETLLLRILATLGGPTAPASVPRPTQEGQKQPPDPDWIAVLHRTKYTIPLPLTKEGPQATVEPGCGQVALYLTRPFSTRERADITAMRVCFPNETDWRQPKPGDISLCSTCGMPINPWSDRDLDYASVLIDVPEVHRVRRRRPPPLARQFQPSESLPLHTPEVDAQNRTQIADLLAAADELLLPAEKDESGV